MKNVSTAQKKTPFLSCSILTTSFSVQHSPTSLPHHTNPKCNMFYKEHASVWPFHYRPAGIYGSFTGHQEQWFTLGACGTINSWQGEVIVRPGTLSRPIVHWTERDKILYSDGEPGGHVYCLISLNIFSATAGKNNINFNLTPLWPPCELSRTIWWRFVTTGRQGELQSHVIFDTCGWWDVPCVVYINNWAK